MLNPLETFKFFFRVFLKPGNNLLLECEVQGRATQTGVCRVKCTFRGVYRQFVCGKIVLGVRGSGPTRQRMFELAVVKF